MMRVLQLEIYFKPVLSWSNTQAPPQGCLRHRRAPWRTSAPPRTASAAAWPAGTCPPPHLSATCRRNDVSVLNTCQSWSMTGMTASFRNFLRKYFHKLKIASLKSRHIPQSQHIVLLLYCYVNLTASQASCEAFGGFLGGIFGIKIINASNLIS